ITGKRNYMRAAGNIIGYGECPASQARLRWRKDDTDQASTEVNRIDRRQRCGALIIDCEIARSRHAVDNPVSVSRVFEWQEEFLLCSYNQFADCKACREKYLRHAACPGYSKDLRGDGCVIRESKRTNLIDSGYRTVCNLHRTC